MGDAAKPVRIVDYDAAWPERFQALARRATRALGGCVLRVEHVGSTSVPGLAAKPVIDLDVVVRAADVPLAIQRLEAIGYTHRGELGIPGRHAFRVPPGEPKHHLYLCVPESEGFRDHLRFRDRLRADPDAAREYAALKRRLADEHGADADAYQHAKRTFIDAVTRRAAPTDPAEPSIAQR